MANSLHQIPACVEPVRRMLIKGNEEISPTKPPHAHIAAFLAHQAKTLGENVFLESFFYGDQPEPASSIARECRRKVTFLELDRSTNQVAHLLISLGVASGESVGFIGENVAEMHLTYLGTAKIGGLCAPLNPKDAIEKWRLTCEDCQVRVIVVQERFFDDKFLQLVRQLTTLKAILVVTTKDAVQDPGLLPCKLLSFHPALSEQSTEFTPPETLSWGDPFLLVYTSGTTGTPKGVVISLETIWRCAQSLNEHFGFGRQDTTYAQLSGFHVNHIVVSFWGALAGGYRVVMSNRFCAEDYFALLSDEKITISSVVPTNLAYALKSEMEKGSIPKEMKFHDSFRSILFSHLSRFLPEKGFREAWEKALDESNQRLDPIPFHRLLKSGLEPQISAKEDFSETFDQVFFLDFARAFHPFFERKYSLSPQTLRIICGAGDLALDLAFQFSRTTGLQITQGWGMSEGTCYNSMSLRNPSWLIYWLTLGSIGQEMTTTNMGIVATDAEMKPLLKNQRLVFLNLREMAQNRVGMMVMRGHVSSLGYYRNSKANEEAYLDGWLLTGDAGCALSFADTPSFRNFVRQCRTLSLAQVLERYPFVEERYLSLLRKMKETGNYTALLQILERECAGLKLMPFYFIKGRIKDIIITKGQNIPCDEIEAGALGCPGVFEAVAVGIADLQDGEVPGIVVTRHSQSTLSACEVLEFCCNRKVLPRIQWPVMAAVVESLPKTPTGKYQRVRAREVFSGTELKAPMTTRQFGIRLLDVAIAKDYDQSRRPKM